MDFDEKVVRVARTLNLIAGDGKPKLDKYGHLIVDHDLHNHNGELSDGIAESFIDWAKKEKLSFWRNEKWKKD